ERPPLEGGERARLDGSDRATRHLVHETRGRERFQDGEGRRHRAHVLDVDVEGVDRALPEIVAAVHALHVRHVRVVLGEVGPVVESVLEHGLRGTQDVLFLAVRDLRHAFFSSFLSGLVSLMSIPAGIMCSARTASKFFATSAGVHPPGLNIEATGMCFWKMVNAYPRRPNTCPFTCAAFSDARNAMSGAFRLGSISGGIFDGSSAPGSSPVVILVNADGD